MVRSSRLNSQKERTIMVTKPWTAAEAKPQLQDDIEVPIDPVIPGEREEAAPQATTDEAPKIQPIPLEMYTEEEIEGLLLKQSQEQQAKNQAVALAAAVQQMQVELVEIRARLAQLEGNA
jgi:hypothetical protein